MGTRAPRLSNHIVGVFNTHFISGHGLNSKGANSPFLASRTLPSLEVISVFLLNETTSKDAVKTAFRWPVVHQLLQFYSE